MPELRNPDHLGHVALHEAQSVMETWASAATPVDEVVAQIGSMFLAGFEFGVRFAQRYPALITSAIAFCDSAPSDGHPLEIRERAMQEDARQMVEGCDA